MIRVSGLTVRFGDRAVIEDLSLEVTAREVVGIMGASGGGKTTLLRCIAGLLKPTEGTVEVMGVDINRCSERERDEVMLKLGVLFQGAALFDYLNVFENVAFGVSRHSRMPKAELKQLVEDRLRRVGLQETEQLLPSQLSGGMRKRVGLARALATDPQILLYDEPTSGLDPITAYSIDSLILELSQSSASASVVISHDLYSVVRVCNRVAFLYEGKIIADGSPKDFFETRDPRIRELIDKAEAKKIEAT